VASQAQPVGYENRSSKTYRETQLRGGDSAACHAEARSAMTALSVEFVAKPEAAREAELAIPAAIDGSLREVGGYGGCLVMVSNQEARLISVVTFWTGANRAQRCNENARWVFALLKPYMDRCLRSQTVFARMPLEATLSAARRDASPGELEKESEEESCAMSVA